MKKFNKVILIACSLILAFFVVFIPLCVFADDSPSTTNPFADLELGNAKSSKEFESGPSPEFFKNEKEEESDNAEESSEESKCCIPGDGFEGDYADFPNKDGTVTRVMDNGGVFTLYPDGSAEGVDYKGNIYTVDNDNTVTIKGIDGDKYICSKDEGDIKEVVSPDGTRTVYNDDGTYMTITPAGVRFELDKKGDIVAASFENGQRLELFDENGDFIQGDYHIYGDNGESFTFIYHDSFSADPDNEDPIQIEFWMDGNGKSYGFKGYNDGKDNIVSQMKLVNDDTIEYNNNVIQNEDGTTSTTCEFNMIAGEGDFEIYNKISTHGDEFEKNGEYTSNWRISCNGEEETGDAGLVMKDGEIYSLNCNSSDGTSFGISTEGNIMKWYDSDNFLVTVNKETGDLELFDDGLYAKANVNTEKVELIHQELEDGSTMDFEDGVWVLRDGITKEEYRITLNDDGSSEMIKPNGDVLTKTADGRLFKNGVQVESFEENTEEVFRPKADDVLGSWDISLKFSNMSSQFIDMIIDVITKAVEEAFDTSLDGEVTSGLEDRVATIPGTMEITKGSGKNKVNATITMYGDSGEAVTYEYKGKIKDGKMTLKLVGESASVDDESISVGLDKLEFELYGRGDKRYMTGVYVLKSFMLNADINYYGERYSAAEATTEEE